MFVTDGIINPDNLEELKRRASFPAATYGLGFDAGFKDDINIQQNCRAKNLDYVYSYLVTKEDNGQLTPDEFVVCVGVLEAK